MVEAPTNPRGRDPGSAWRAGARSGGASLVLVLALLACQSTEAPPEPGATATMSAAPDASSGAATSADGGRGVEVRADGGGAPADPAASRVVPLLPLAGALASRPGGTTPLGPDGVADVDPSATFEVRVGARVPAARMLLLDAQDAIVASSSSTEIGPESVFRLSPAEPLRSGSSYVLRLEGLHSRAVLDADGHSYGPLSLRLRVTGDPPAAPGRRSRKRSAR